MGVEAASPTGRQAASLFHFHTWKMATIQIHTGNSRTASMNASVATGTTQQLAADGFYIF